MTKPSKDTQSSENGDQLIERYLDGLLTEKERTSFLDRLQSDRALQSQLDLAEQVSASLGRSFAWPECDEPATKQDRSRVFRLSQPIRLVLAAAAAVLAIGIAIKLNLPPPAHDFHTLLERAYANYESTGFTPEWVCETDEEFEAAVRDRLGQSMLIDATAIEPVKIELLGWAYSQDSSGYSDTIISDDSMILLTRVDGQGVILIVDRVEDDGEPLTIGDHLGLSVFRRVLGDLVLYEVTPMDEPSVLGRAFVPRSDGR